jgi:hypothetical protein
VTAFKVVAAIAVLVFLGIQRLAQFLMYTFFVLLFGYGSVVLLRDFRAWSQERRARRTVHAA